MAHKRIIVDTDSHFLIDATTRSIKQDGNAKIAIMQHDHNSERFSFTIPRFVDGHDMSECNRVEVHYVNTDTKTKEQIKDKYTVDDLSVNPENENEVIFSWLIARTATKYYGSLAFSIRFLCFDGDEVVYVWNTDRFESIPVGDSCDCNGELPDHYDDNYESWKKEIESLLLEHENNENVNVKHLTDAEKSNVEKIPEELEAIREDIVVVAGYVDRVSGDVNFLTDRVYALEASTVTDIPTTLEANTAYNFGSQNASLTLTFPSIANDGDVIYIGFVCREGLNLVVDTTNTFDFDLVPEKDTGYEIYAKCTTNLGVLRWILKYSEYSGVGE